MVNEKRLIDANALKQMFDEREADDVEMYGCHIVECFPADDAKEIVDKMPTVDAVKVVHAHWIYDDDEVDGNMQAHCSNCFAGDVHAAWKKNSVPYCWSCGAKMDEDFKGVEIDQFKKED